MAVVEVLDFDVALKECYFHKQADIVLNEKIST